MWCFLLFVSLSFGQLLSAQEIQKRIDDAYGKENEHVAAERLRFANAILPVLEKAIVKGEISVHFTNRPEAICDGMYGDIRPLTFCDWWKQHFNKTMCTFTSDSNYCPIGIRFYKD